MHDFQRAIEQIDLGPVESRRVLRPGRPLPLIAHDIWYGRRGDEVNRLVDSAPALAIIL